MSERVIFPVDRIVWVELAQQCLALGRGKAGRGSVFHTVVLGREYEENPKDLDE